MREQIPDSVRDSIDAAVMELNADGHHRLSHTRRKKIYTAFRESSDERGARTLRWLAVIAAQRVLPFFAAEYPDDALPEQLINTAVGIMRGEINDADADDILEQGYNASGASWGYDEGEISWSADLAGRSAYHALLESRGYKPLEQLEKIFELGVVGMPSGNWLEKFPEPKGADQFTDENLCEFPNCDTAGIAAVAFSCLPEGPVCDKSKLKEFWTWWLLEAIQKAWDLAGE